MKTTHVVWISLTAMASFVLTSAVLVGAHGAPEPADTLVETVRQATRDFQDVAKAEQAGYISAGTCVSGPEEGAMGVHFVNGALIGEGDGDGELDPNHPEILVYEPKNGQFRLVAVEYVVDAAKWHANNEMPPALLGQHFHYNGSPNRYRLPAFYELHVWAWKQNPNGMFTDWNPKVSCEDYVPEVMTPPSARAHR